MTHPTQIECLMYVDGALSTAQSTALQSHFGTCSVCCTTINNLRMENQSLSEVLSSVEPKQIPAFYPPVSLQGLGLTLAATALVACLSTMLWVSLYSSWLVEVFSWFSSIHIGDAIGATVYTVFYFSDKGISMIDLLLNVVFMGLLFSGLVYFMTSNRGVRGAVSFCLSLLVVGTLFSAPTAQALDVRFGESTVTVDEGETIDDTLVVAGEAAIIDGVVNGDLIVFGQRVVVNGTVTGNIITFSQSATIAGEVGGSVLGFADSFDVTKANIAQNLWSFSQKFTFNEDASVVGNATMFTNRGTVAGNVGRDLTSFGQSIDLSGEVGEDLEAFGESINLIGNAYVGGNVRFRSARESALQQSSTSVIVGEVEHIINPEFNQRNESGIGGKILFQAIRLIMAFAAGMALLWFFPILQKSTIKSGFEGVKSAGIGLLALICLPVIGIICAFTIVGLPFSIIGFFIWMLGLYFAKILVAAIVGRMLITAPEKQDHYALTLFAGLVVVILIVNVPWIGGVLSFIMTLVGLGLLVQYLLVYLASLEDSLASLKAIAKANK